VQVSLVIAIGVPYEDLTGWDQVNECSIELPSGRLSIEGGTWVTPIATIEVDPGTYGARIYYGNLDPLKPNIPNLKDCYRGGSLEAFRPNLGAGIETNAQKRFHM
jgi:hypothetical protein